MRDARLSFPDVAVLIFSLIAGFASHPCPPTPPYPSPPSSPSQVHNTAHALGMRRQCSMHCNICLHASHFRCPRNLPQQTILHSHRSQVHCRPSRVRTCNHAAQLARPGPHCVGHVSPQPLTANDRGTLACSFYLRATDQVAAVCGQLQALGNARFEGAANLIT